MTVDVEVWELGAREKIRGTLARYNWSGDAGMIQALAETFCVDGVLEIRNGETLRGRSEIVGYLSNITVDVTVNSGARPIVRHNVANVMFSAMETHQADVSCYFTVFTHIGLDHFGRYRDVLVPVTDHWLIKHRKVSVDWAAPASAMSQASHA
jgi:hypothetical protein